MSRARDLADSASGVQLVDITSSFTRNSAWTKSGTERVLHDPSTNLVYYQLGLYIDATPQSGGQWNQPASTSVIYTIASAYRPSEAFVTTNITADYDSSTIEIKPNGDVIVLAPENYTDARFRVYINGWYKI